MGMLCGGAELLSCVRLFATPRTVASQAPLSMGFSRQKYRSGLPCPSSRDLPDPEIVNMLHILCILNWCLCMCDMPTYLCVCMCIIFNNRCHLLCGFEF